MTLFRTYWIEICVAAILSIVCIVSFSTLTTKPRLWSDEAVTLEIARNMYESGVLNAQPSPGVWYEAPYVLQSTGYPVTLSLAAAYSLFDYGFTQARVAMLAWMLAALLICFFFLRSLFGKDAALGSVLLLATFASFHATGRTATGEIPGFALLALGLYFWLTRKNLLVAGIFMGLAVVAKPSVLIFTVPAITIALLLQGKPFLERVRDVVYVGSSMALAAILWIVLIIPEPFSLSAWQTILQFLANPYSAALAPPSISSLILHSTVFYFALWCAVIALAYRYAEDGRERLLYLFVGTFTFFAFAYYLRSPGWLRYLIVAELLILSVLPIAFRTLQTRGARFLTHPAIRFGAAASVVVIALFQVVQYQSAEIYTSDLSLRIAEYVNTEYPDASVHTLSIFGVFPLLDTRERYTYSPFGGVKPLGEPFDGSVLPDVVIVDVAGKGINYDSTAVEILEKHYHRVTVIETAEIYVRN
jgi:4-amino-4-deoxy-L-arabinose transferase-like glycosyltransferase